MRRREETESISRDERCRSSRCYIRNLTDTEEDNLRDIEFTSLRSILTPSTTLADSRIRLPLDP